MYTFQWGGNKCAREWQIYINLFTVWILTGLWHGASWNYVAWGLGYFVLIAFERATGLPKRLTLGLSRFVYRILTLLFINFQWVMFNSGGIKNGLRFIKRMIVFRADKIMDLRTCFLIKDYWFFILIAVVLCFPVVPWLRTQIRKERLQIVFDTCISVVIMLAFVWSLSFVIAGQNNPFAYANF